MARITIFYKTYSLNYPVLSELEFYQLKAILEEDPYFDCFPIKTQHELILEFFNEFKLQLALTLGIGLLLGIFNSKEFIGMLFLPLIVWLIFGGIVSLLNFYTCLKGYDKYNKALQQQFPEFETYEQYLYFRKFEALKFIG